MWCASRYRISARKAALASPVDGDRSVLLGARRYGDRLSRGRHRATGCLSWSWLRPSMGIEVVMLRIVTQARALTTLLPALLIACAATAPHALAGEFMIMPTIAFAHQNRSSPDPTLERQQYIADLFYSGDIGSFRLLGELQVDPGGYDMERLQAGWRVTPDISLWFGRYHNPIGYWNMEHHHGHYMETSAERPQIVEFEDEGGPLPIHLFGLLLQGMHPIGDASLQYDLGVASGPRVVDGEFGPVDVVRKPRFNKLALVARVAYRPDAAQDDQYGAFVARTKIPAEGLDFTEIQQDLAGIYLSRDIDRLRVFGEVFRINHRVLQGPGVVWPSYWAGYAQAEYKVIPV